MVRFHEFFIQWIDVQENLEAALLSQPLDIRNTLISILNYHFLVSFALLFLSLSLSFVGCWLGQLKKNGGKRKAIIRLLFRPVKGRLELRHMTRDYIYAMQAASQLFIIGVIVIVCKLAVTMSTHVLTLILPIATMFSVAASVL